MNVIFGVRNCSSRGLLIESIENNNGGVFLLKYQDQPMDKHCTQMQNILRSANVKRARKITIDISGFFNEYQNPIDKSAWFKGIKLESVDQQIKKTLTKRINIDVGIIKRKKTIQDNKETKAAKKKEDLEKKLALVERSFQEERTRRILQLTKERKQGSESME